MVALSRVENQKLEEEHALGTFLFEGSRIFLLFAKFGISSGRLLFYLLEKCQRNTKPPHFNLVIAVKGVIYCVTTATVKMSRFRLPRRLSWYFSDVYVKKFKILFYCFKKGRDRSTCALRARA